MTALRYRSNVCVGDLAVDECTIHRAGDSSGARWWLLWFRVNREDTGQLFDVAVPVNPNGDYVADGPGGKTWGLLRTYDPGRWQIAPSVNVTASSELHPGAHDSPSRWHQTPSIVDVPEGEAWIVGPP